MENKTKNYRLKFVKYIKREHVDYVIRLICLEDDKINVEFLERYSTLKDLHEILKKEANSINFPKFPPKKFFGNTDEKFLNQRQTALEHYFNTILGSKEFSTIPSLKKWIESLIIKYNKISTNSPVLKPKEDRPSVLNVPRPNIVDNIQPQPTAPKNGNDNNPHYEPEDCFVRERNYKNVLKNNGVFNNLNSNLFKIDAGNNLNFDFLGLEESKLSKYDNIMLSKLNQMYKTINSVIPEDYIVEELVTKINYDKSLIQSTINTLRQELNDANFNQKQPEQLEKELEKLLSNYKSLTEKIQIPIQVKQEIKIETPQITKIENQNKTQQINKLCSKEEKIVKDIFKNLKPERINEFYESKKNYEICLQLAKNSSL